MQESYIDLLMKRAGEIWGPLSTELVANARMLMEELAAAAAAQKIGGTLVEAGSSVELHRNSRHGFILSAYSENEGRYREPHNHGACWVVYAVVEGDVEMGTYGESPSGRGGFLVRRDSTCMGPGAAKVFLPGDIHDTLCLSARAVIVRLTSCDLRKEEVEGRMKRFDQAARMG